MEAVIFHSLSTIFVKNSRSRNDRRGSSFRPGRAFEKIQQSNALDRVGNEGQNEDEDDEDAQDRPFRAERRRLVDDRRMIEAHPRFEFEEEKDGCQYDPGHVEENAHAGKKSDHDPGEETGSASENSVGDMTAVELAEGNKVKGRDQEPDPAGEADRVQNEG